MSERPSEAPEGHGGEGIPRDLPDQQADAETGPDHWDADGSSLEDREGEPMPDTDEAGTGPRGAPQPSGVNPDEPAPDEPTD
ncbi:hypothetical protein [Streptomyces sp. bgisy100]|uniref:hypothetical protein n=1 Tax=Streptomyces sp. bgisy100 TaxID=3413783 RepID=UPI003D744327